MCSELINQWNMRWLNKILELHFYSYSLTHSVSVSVSVSVRYSWTSSVVHPGESEGEKRDQTTPMGPEGHRAVYRDYNKVSVHPRAKTNNGWPLLVSSSSLILWHFVLLKSRASPYIDTVSVSCSGGVIPPWPAAWTLILGESYKSTSWERYVTPSTS